MTLSVIKIKVAGLPFRTGSQSRIEAVTPMRELQVQKNPPVGGLPRGVPPKDLDVSPVPLLIDARLTDAARGTLA
jgi:hypothetical protein